jgi:hypothetical protein
VNVFRARREVHSEDHNRNYETIYQIIDVSIRKNIKGKIELLENRISEIKSRIDEERKQ